MASPARVSLKTFLATAKKALSAPAAQRPTPLTFVVGNESADLDSLCSAVLLAYFRTHTPPHTLHIPLSNLPRADLALRPELGAVLRPAGLRSEDLITLSDLPKDGLHPDQTRWLLVDHNAPTGDLASQFTTAGTTNLLIGCIDHHEDEGVVPEPSSPDDPRVIAKCGSCTSLVVEHYKSAWDKLTAAATTSTTSSTSPDSIDAQLAHLAIGPILIDTTNLTSADKTTDIDISAVQTAESKLTTTAAVTTTTTSSAYDRTAFFDKITRLKEDISGLSHRDMLRKDYKRWSDGRLTLGVSSVVRGFDYLTAAQPGGGGGGGQRGFLDALRAWAAEQRLDLAAVMTVSRPEGGGFARELLVWAFGKEAAAVARRFAEENGERLGLERWREGVMDEEGGGESGAEWRACWTQQRVENSRKQVAPLLREAMRESCKL